MFRNTQMILRDASAFWLLGFALSLSAAGQDSQNRPAVVREVLLNFTELFRWQNYWFPDTLNKAYVPGKDVQVQTFFTKSAVGFCASALEICQIYEKKAGGKFQFLMEWVPEPDSFDLSLAQRFGEEYSKAKASQSLPLGEPTRSQEKRTFDVTRMVGPVREQRHSEAFEQALSLTWKLLPLALPKSISDKTLAPDAATLRSEAIKIAKSYKTDCGSSGVGTIPFYGEEDRRVFVYVELGGTCEKGVFEFLRRPEGGWAFNRFVVDSIDLSLLVPRIQEAKMETFGLPD